MVKTDITVEEVAKVAKLASLSLTNSEIEKFTPQLAGIIAYVGELKEVDTGNISPTAQVNNLTNVTRDDAVESNRVLSQKTALGQAGRVEKNLFAVKAIFEND